MRSYDRSKWVKIGLRATGYGLWALGWNSQVTVSGRQSKCSGMHIGDRDGKKKKIIAKRLMCAAASPSPTGYQVLITT